MCRRRCENESLPLRWTTLITSAIQSLSFSFYPSPRTAEFLPLFRLVSEEAALILLIILSTIFVGPKIFAAMNPVPSPPVGSEDKTPLPRVMLLLLDHSPSILVLRFSVCHAQGIDPSLPGLTIIVFSFLPRR